MKNRVFYVLTVILASSFAYVSMAEIYTWKDSSGKTVYSDRPPTGVDAVPMNIKAPKAAVKSKQSQVQDSQSSASDSAQEVAKKNAQIKEQNAKVAENNAKIKEQNCKNARQALSSLQGGMRVAVPDGKGGRTFPNDVERNRMVQKANEDVKTWCN